MSAELSPERELSRQLWRERVMDFIANRVVSPMVRIDLTNLEKGYSDDIIS